MKKTYTTPEIEIIQFDMEACITMSGETTTEDRDNFFDMENTGWE